MALVAGFIVSWLPTLLPGIFRVWMQEKSCNKVFFHEYLYLWATKATRFDKKIRKVRMESQGIENMFFEVRCPDFVVIPCCLAQCIMEVAYGEK